MSPSIQSILWRVQLKDGRLSRIVDILLISCRIICHHSLVFIIPLCNSANIDIVLLQRAQLLAIKAVIITIIYHFTEFTFGCAWAHTSCLSAMDFPDIIAIIYSYDTAGHGRWRGSAITIVGHNLRCRSQWSTSCRLILNFLITTRQRRDSTAVNL